MSIRTKLLKLIKRVGVLQDYAKMITRGFPELFQGLGKMEGEYSIKLKENSQPYALSTCRRVPIPLMKAVKTELTRMEKAGVISRVTEPSDWCAGMVVVPKKNNTVRICVDLTKLNKCVKRERHPLPAVEQVLAQLAEASVFSKLDANSGFWQIPLSAKSAPLTTFITPFGRFCFHRLPFGITSAPEHFQRRMSEILEGLEGVVCMLDDTLIYGKTQEEHDHRLQVALQRLKAAGVTLNQQKCLFSVSEITFLGQVISKHGIQPDPSKIEAINRMEAPTDVAGARRLLGTVNQLGKFIPNLAQITQPIRELLVKSNQWMWEEPQQTASQRSKKPLSQVQF